MITDLYQQSVFTRYHSDKHFSEFLPTRWRQKSTGTDNMEQITRASPYYTPIHAHYVQPWRR